MLDYTIRYDRLTCVKKLRVFSLVYRMPPSHTSLVEGFHGTSG